MRSPLVVLMTATVDPGEYSGQVSRNASRSGTRDYLEAIKFWAAHPDRRIQGVVFCENSGADSAHLRRGGCWISFNESVRGAEFSWKYAPA